MVPAKWRRSWRRIAGTFRSSARLAKRIADHPTIDVAPPASRSKQQRFGVGVHETWQMPLDSGPDVGAE